MKKKIAVLANYWSSDIVDMFFEGLTKSIPEESMDFYVFVAANSYGRDENINRNEMEIHNLPYLEDYDVIIIFSQGLNSDEHKQDLYDKCSKLDKPVILIGDNYPGFYGITANNYTGMRALVEHIYEKHNAKKYFFIAGAPSNPDSAYRLEVVQEFAKEKNLEFTDDDVFYSNWELGPVHNIIVEKYKTKEDLPDAIICANDFIAMSVCNALDLASLTCPEDVIITGYDNVRSNKIYYPSISTVDQNYGKAGEKAAEIILGILDGKTEVYSTTVDTECVIGESCGCKSLVHEKNRNNFCHNKVEDEYIGFFRRGRLFDLSHELNEADRFAQIAPRLQKIFYKDNGSEGSCFHIMMDTRFGKLAYEGVERVAPKYQFADEFKVIVSKMDGRIAQAEKYPRRNLVPTYDSYGKNRMFIFMPIYYKTFSCGYLCMEGPQQFGNEWYCNEYSECINESIKNFINNIQLSAVNDKLSAIMHTDPMTRVKNRAAFEEFKEQLQLEYVKNPNMKFGIAMFDINNLKQINDIYGHDSGDQYIKNCCHLICKVFEHSAVFRLGGDEFLAILKEGKDLDKLDELRKMFNEKMIESQNEEDVVDRLSIASGFGFSEEITLERYEDIFKIADDNMYKVKKMMKGQN